VEARPNLVDLVGETPLVRLPAASRRLGVSVSAKLELCNPTGSIKDRPARYIVEQALALGMIEPGSLLVESSSGNFGVALANMCRHHGLRFACVVDPNVTPMHHYMMCRLGAELHMVDTRDESGGYLNTRLERVHELLDEEVGAFWTNQYANEWNTAAHYHGTGPEILRQTEGRIHHLFAAVSSGGTISGCARYLKEKIPDLTVVAVDAEGSAIFGRPPRSRFIPGVGSSMVPKNVDRSLIDVVIHVPEEDTILECHRLLREEGIFAGGSSGTVMAAIRRYFEADGSQQGARVVAIFPDRGERYFQTVYDPVWVAKTYPALRGSGGIHDVRGAAAFVAPSLGAFLREGA